LRLVKESIPYILVPLVLAMGTAAVGYWYVSGILFIVALFMAYFFRHPNRVPPSDTDVVVSPADGRVTRIEPQSPGTVISIFLSPLDVHINRSPIEATLSRSNNGVHVVPALTVFQTPPDAAPT